MTATGSTSSAALSADAEATATAPSTPAPSTGTATPIVTRFSYGPAREQYVDRHVPIEVAPRAHVVLIHGGFWRDQYTASETESLAVDLAQRGYAAWNVEYRRVGGGGGWPNTLDDVAAAIDLLATVPDTDVSRVVAVGHSAGGQLAVWAAARAGLPTEAPGASPVVPLAGAVSLAGVLDLTGAAVDGVGTGAITDFLGGLPDEVPGRYPIADPTLRVPLGVPTVALHARDDDVVPFSQSKRFVGAATAAGDSSHLVEVDGGHYDVVDPSTPAWQSVLAAIDELIPG